jgi:hypothetical protein
MWSLINVAALCAGLILVQSAGAQADPALMPAREAHQGLVIAANPLVTPEQYKERFGKPTPRDAGIVAIEVFVRNDNDSPVRIDLEAVRLRIGVPGEARRRLGGLTAEEVADRTLLKAQADPRQSRLPFPLPGGGARSGRSKDWEKFASQLRTMAFPSAVLPPHGTVSGFFYFDIANYFPWLSNASLDVPDLELMVGNQALLFFEVELAPAIR